MGRRWRFGAFELAVDERRLLADGRPVPLGGRAFDLLCERALIRYAHGSLLAEKQMVQDCSPVSGRVWWWRTTT